MYPITVETKLREMNSASGKKKQTIMLIFQLFFSGTSKKSSKENLFLILCRKTRERQIDVEEKRSKMNTDYLRE